MTKDNIKNNSASAKVAKVSSQIKAATAEAEGKSTAIKVNRGKAENKSAGAKPKNDSAVAVNIQKTKKVSSPKSATKPGAKNPKAGNSRAASKPAGSAKNSAQNSRILNVVELGDGGAVNANSKNSMDGMVRPQTGAEKSMKTQNHDVSAAEKSTEVAQKSQNTQKSKKSGKKKQKKLWIIILAVVLVIGLGAGAVVWALNRNNREMCTVDFESNGGSEVESIQVVCGTKVSQPDDPEKDGFDFREWAYRGKRFDFDKAIDEDIILVAKWDAAEDTETVTISFDSAGGSEVEDIIIKAGTATMAPSDPRREGYSFDGWYFGDEKFSFADPIDEDVTLTAHWTSNQPENSGNNSNNSRPSSNQTNQNSGSQTQQPSTTPDPGNSGNTGGSSGSTDPGDGTGGSGTGDGSGSTNPGGPDTGEGGGSTTPGGDGNVNVPNPDGSAPTQP